MSVNKVDEIRPPSTTTAQGLGDEPATPASAEANGGWKQGDDRRHRRHQNWPEPDGPGGHEGLAGGLCLAGPLGEVDQLDGIVHHEPEHHQDAEQGRQAEGRPLSALATGTSQSTTTGFAPGSLVTM